MGCLVQSLDHHVHPISLLWISFYVGNKLKNLINEATVLSKMYLATRTSLGSDTTIPVKMLLTEFKAGLATLHSLQLRSRGHLKLISDMLKIGVLHLIRIIKLITS